MQSSLQLNIIELDKASSMTYLILVRITTEVQSAPAGELVPITDGSMEYNFMSSQVQLTAVFMEYKLKENSLI